MIDTDPGYAFSLRIERFRLSPSLEETSLFLNCQD